MKQTALCRNLKFQNNNCWKPIYPGGFSRHRGGGRVLRRGPVGVRKQVAAGEPQEGYKGDGREGQVWMRLPKKK